MLFVKIKILPAKKPKKVGGMSERKAGKIREAIRKKQEKKALAKKEKEAAKKEKEKTKEKKPLSQQISDIKILVDVVLTALGKFFGHLRIKMTRIKIVVASEDAATTAVAYGAISQSLNILLPALETVKNFKSLDKADIDVRADFLSSSPEFDIEISLSIRVWHILHAGLAALVKFIKRKLKEGGKSKPSQSPKAEIKK